MEAGFSRLVVHGARVGPHLHQDGPDQVHEDHVRLSKDVVDLCVFRPLLQEPGARMKLMPHTKPLSLYMAGVMLSVASFWS